MLNRKKISLFIIVLGFLFIVWVQYIQHKGDISVNQHNCATVKMAIKGTITMSQGRSPYERILVNNIKENNPEDMIWVNTAKDLSVKGFKDAYYFKEGDSVIKQANSKIITFKRGDSSVISVLDCND